jgi:sister-chromatid-cohesion protein PDS5
MFDDSVALVLTNTWVRQNLYLLSELAQHIISVRAKARNWSLSSYPGKVKMPGDIFKPLPSNEVAKDVRIIYLF